MGMNKVSKHALLSIAQRTGATLEFNHPFVREVDELKWIRHRQMYQRLYGRIRSKKVQTKMIHHVGLA
jgi:hypothetical protein